MNANYCSNQTVTIIKPVCFVDCYLGKSNNNFIIVENFKILTISDFFSFISNFNLNVIRMDIRL